MKINYKKLTFAVSLGLICWSSINAQSIAAGGWHSLVICSDSTVKAFGENATGELGDGTTTDRNTPVTAIGLSGIISVSGGGDQLEAHSLALKSNGTVWSWGSNIYGGLGNGTTTNTTVPGQVLVLSGITAISAGGWHSAALKKDSTVWTWGWNTDGQIGDGTNVDRTVPVQVPGLTGIKAIAAGTYHMLALKSNGTVWCWGDNVSGQIGDGTLVDRNTPIQVSGLTDVVRIAAGRFFSLAVKSDGTVWTWGENVYGQLGDGTTTDRHTPVQVTGLTGITSAVAATGAFHCMAVKNDNTVWAWGRNTYGNLGDNTVVNKSAPVLMTGISSVAGLAAGTNFSLLYKTDGTFWGCGRNASGQLGDGTFTQRNIASQSTSVCTILPPTGISENNAAVARINTFPNPSSDGQFAITMVNQLSGTGNRNDCKIEIYNVIGEKVLETKIMIQELNSGATINLSNRPNGMYILSLQVAEHTINQKLIKQ
jgi:alpha-tubulin suppressor-like RCC1 family protein